MPSKGTKLVRTGRIQKVIERLREFMNDEPDTFQAGTNNGLWLAIQELREEFGLGEVEQGGE